MQPASSSPSTTPVAPSVAPRRRRGWWLVGGLLASVALAAWPARAAYLGHLESRCRAALQAQDWPALEQAAAQWTRWQPQRAAPWMFAAQAAHEQERDDLAVEYLGQVPPRDPQAPLALLERSNLQFGALNRPLDGAASCRRALELNPTLVEGYRRLVFFYAYTLQRRKLVALIHDAIEWECDLPETYLYLVGQDWMSFSNGYDENTHWMRGARDEELFLVARAIFRVSSQALDEEAEKEKLPGVSEDEMPYHLQILTQYLEKYPQNLEILAYFLKRASKEGDVPRVTQLLAQAPPDSAHDHRFWRYQGWLQEAREELPQAENSYRKCLELNPYDHIAQHQLAGVLRLQGKLDDVERLERLYQDGRVLRREILTLPNVTQAPRPLMWKVATHIANCGQAEVAQQLTRRLQTLDRLAPHP